MNVWMLLYGVGMLGLGAFILLNKERTLRLSQKYLRLNVGRIGSDVADAGKPSHMIGPGSESGKLPRSSTESRPRRIWLRRA